MSPQDRRLLSTVARWIRKFGGGKQEEKQQVEEQETIKELLEIADKVFGPDKL